ncbi:MAG: molybdopterin-dependent oxidoreductase [Actinomycetota bacterium]|nr:molybdopterin-dependent oxidoreductase [Actinomycetota bacterium]
MPADERLTFCRICEANCGMVATIEDGRVTKLRPDREHPLSQGYACPKGIAFPELQDDPDRLVHPMRRRAGGEFERVSWDEALADIGARLRALRDEHGGDSIGMYMGNPAAWSFGHTVWGKGLIDALGSPHYYSAGSQDVNSRFAASALLYGTPLTVPIPDVPRTDMLVIFGANPFVSNGSVLSIPRVRDRLREIVRRGGRVVVVDPRRTETAREFEHVPLRPDGDARLLLSLLHVVFAEGLAAPGALCEGADELERAAAAHPPEETEAWTGVPAERVRALARDIAAASGAAIYGRTGTCLGRHGTLVSFLLDALAGVTGNLDRPGGLVYGISPLGLEEVAERNGLATYGARHSRVGGYPDVLGQMPATLMAPEIETPGPGRLRALIVTAGNPLLSVPDGAALRRALPKLDLMVSIDLYLNDTGRLADYVLPATTWLERDDVPAAFQQFFYRPFIQYTEAMVEPRGEARPEWEVFDELAHALGVVPQSIPAARLMGRLGVRPGPRRAIDLMLRTGPRGDLFGVRRGGLSLARVEREPHGMVLDEHWATGVLPKRIKHRPRRVRLAPPEILEEVRRLEAEPPPGDGELPLRLIGMRELRSHNSWMHNVPALMRGGSRRHTLRMHPDDAAARGLADGAAVRVRSASGAVSVPVLVTDEMTPGVVALPHGWGHSGGWRLANESGGANSNELTSADPASLERLAGMSHLNGVPVEVEAVASAGAELAVGAHEAAAAPEVVP